MWKHFTLGNAFFLYHHLEFFYVWRALLFPEGNVLSTNLLQSASDSERVSRIVAKAICGILHSAVHMLPIAGSLGVFFKSVDAQPCILQFVQHLSWNLSRLGPTKWLPHTSATVRSHSTKTKKNHTFLHEVFVACIISTIPLCIKFHRCYRWLDLNFVSLLHSISFSSSWWRRQSHNITASNFGQWRFWWIICVCCRSRGHDWNLANICYFGQTFGKSAYGLGMPSESPRTWRLTIPLRGVVTQMQIYAAFEGGARCHQKKKKGSAKTTTWLTR